MNKSKYKNKSEVLTLSDKQVNNTIIKGNIRTGIIMTK